MDLELLKQIESQTVEGTPASVADAEALWLSISPDEDLAPLCDAAGRVAAARMGSHIDTCSIINARSGRCTEDCKWCAQAACHHTGCEEYPFCSESEFIDGVRTCADRGVHRYSMVCSGRKVALKDIRVFAAMYGRAHKEYPQVSLCASMGLLNRQELQALYDSGVRRYHCNIETAASYFPELCTTHTRADKLRTIALAREVGMEVCVGGIIGMGETMRQRLELAEEARLAGAVSLPLNLLNPIPGTPLADTPPARRARGGGLGGADALHSARPLHPFRRRPRAPEPCHNRAHAHRRRRRRHGRRPAHHPGQLPGRGYGNVRPPRTGCSP